MKGTDQWRSPPVVLLAAQGGNGFGSGKQSLCGTGPQGTNHLRSDGLQLLKQEWGTGLDLIIKGGPVVREGGT